MSDTKQSSVRWLAGLTILVVLLLVWTSLPGQQMADGFVSGVNWLSEQWEMLTDKWHVPGNEADTEREKITQRVVDEESAVIEIVEQASPAVVSVLERSVTFDFFSGPRLTENSIGTGFVASDNLIVTNKHVVSDQSAEYTVVDTAGNRFEAEQVYRDPLNDLALIKIKTDEPTDFVPLELGDSDTLKVGQTVVAIGNALGKFSNTVTKGVVSGKGRGITASGGLGSFQEELEDVIQTDAALNPGNSGGPLLNLAGQVIGVNVAVGVGSENIGFAIPSNTVKDLITDFEAGIVRARPFLGVRYAMITAEFARNSEFPEGALVREVIVGGPAEKSGLKINDVIVEFDGESVNASNLLSAVILRHRAGDRVELTIWRNGAQEKLSVMLEAAPEE